MTMKDVVRREATSVYKTIPVSLRSDLAPEQFTYLVNNTNPKRNYSSGELREIFEELQNTVALH
jgi:hypothetical protein